MTKNGLVSRAVWSASFALLAASFLVPLILRPETQWDFTTYYHAARVYVSGGDPYRLADISAMFGSRVYLPFVYPPTALGLFVPFGVLDFHTAALVFLLIKLALYLFLIRLWDAEFFGSRAGPYFALFTLLAFNAAVFADFRSGNPGLIEEAVLWTGFALFMRGRYGGFSAAIVLCALLKVQPLVFLFLLFLVEPGRRAMRRVLIALIAYGAVNASFRAVDPALFASFADSVSGPYFSLVWFEKGRINPSLFALIEDLMDLPASFRFAAVPDAVRALAHVACASGVALFALDTLRRRPAVPDARARKTLFFFGLLTYALLVPRFKDYTYVLLIVPAYEAVLRSGERRGAAAWAAALFVLSSTAAFFPARLFFIFVWEYFPLVLAGGLWGFYAHEIRRHTAHV